MSLSKFQRSEFNEFLNNSNGVFGVISRPLIDKMTKEKLVSIINKFAEINVVLVMIKSQNCRSY